ncbi:MAG: OmpP1/FadL family transporter [Hyphomicrobium sp.]
MAALAAATSMAAAGGFAPHEQSAVFLGSAFAGSAAGGSLGSMFWNPAALGQFNGVNSESAYSLILPNTEITSTGSTLDAFGTSSGDIGDTAILPASYFSYQLNEQIVLGLGVNAPFGLTTDGNFSWAGSVFARESKITTYNFTPTVAYRVAPGVIVGAGLQIEYIDAQLRQAFGAPGGPTAAIKGTDTAVGFTAGILLTPTAGTSIGLGFRSMIEHELDGTFHIAGVAAKNDVSANVDLPEIVTLSLRQDLMPAWTLLGSVEWTNWSRLDQLLVTCDAAGAPACGAPGATLALLPLGWDDGWFFSLGLEHEYSSQLTLRAGAAYEISPIQDAEGRTIRVPDADRFWLSAGASYKYSEWTTIDVAYAHVFVEDASTVQLAPGPVVLNGDVESSADILSIGVRSKLDWLFSGSH